jgi:hypothetical protein
LIPLALAGPKPYVSAFLSITRAAGHKFQGRSDPDVKGGTVRTLALGVAVAAAGLMYAPPASAVLAVGNYSFNVEGRYDFHTWLWMINSCNPPDQTTVCAQVSAVAQPIAKAYAWYGQAHVVNGRWAMTVDVPDGLRCGDIYYGPVIPTHDVYSWDPVTLAGTLESTSDVGCDNAPGGTITYPFTLTRL